MVSLQEERKIVGSTNFETLSKKRKWQEYQGDHQDQDEVSKREPKLWHKEQAHHIDLHLDSPLPLEWQRCLDIKSGQIHFYNTRTQKRTSKDPRSSPEPQAGPNLGLDLELNLNLTRNSPTTTTKHDVDEQRVKICKLNEVSNRFPSSTTCSPSWISLDNIDRQEMVAAVCMRCHMLVMMCKANPSCPNCKFVHPQGQSPSSLLLNNNKPGFRLLCCKD